MANIKSQIKRNRQNENARLRNKAVKSELRTRIKKAVTTAPSGGEESEASSERMDFLVDGAALPDETVSATVDGERRLIWLQQALTVLSERELRILRERRLAEDQATLEALGHRLGISKERVRQIENRALEKLRRALAEKFPQSAGSVYAG